MTKMFLLYERQNACASVLDTFVMMVMILPVLFYTMLSLFQALRSLVQNLANITLS